MINEYERQIFSAVVVVAYAKLSLTLFFSCFSFFLFCSYYLLCTMWGSMMMMKGYGFDFDFVMIIREDVDKLVEAEEGYEGSDVGFEDFVDDDEIWMEIVCG